MKKNIIIKGLCSVLVAGMMSSCAGDYLDLKPITAVSAASVGESLTGARAAMAGVVRQTYRQFGDLKNGNYNYNGEYFWRLVFGELPGQDMISGVMVNYEAYAKLTNFRSITGWWAIWGWYYNYGIISAANTLLSQIPNVPTQSQDEVNELKTIKAITHTMRAFAYIELLQVYAPRWVDSNNGSAVCLILRTEPEREDKAFAPMNDVLNLIYSDLDEAERLFTESNYEYSSIFMPNIDVARGLYARAALLKNDYATAKTKAKQARYRYQIMTANEYMEGFNAPNREWMWAPEGVTNVYYWAFGTTHSPNGRYTKSWGYTDQMNYELASKIPATDIRAKLYFTPLLVAMEPALAQKCGITPQSFFKSSVYSQTKLGISMTSRNGDESKGMLKFIRDYGKTFVQDVGNGVYAENKKGISIGVQYKFQCVDSYGTLMAPFMRAAEMLLIEAEAAAETGDEATAKSCLNELMAQRDPTYSCTVSGQALKDEIKLQRRIELWGEGFSWFDLKRWNLPVVRGAWNPNNMSSTPSWPNTLVGTFETSDFNGWRCAVPNSEFTYNKLANPAEVGL